MSIEWSNISLSEGEQISVKGFVYQDCCGQWILSSEPDLKSCCIGASAKRDSQILLQGDFPHFSKSAPMHVQGTVHKNEHGAYYLTDISAFQKKSFPIGTSIGLLAIVILGAAKLRRLLLP